MQVRSLRSPIGDIAARADEWLARVRSPKSNTLVELGKLYQGEAWTQVNLLARDLIAAGYEPQVLVASAGLGLQRVEASAVPYSATFAAKQVDSVASNTTDARLWWRQLEDNLGLGTLAGAAGDRALLVLSESYAKAMHEDLRELGARGGDILLVGGSGDVAGIPRIPTDNALRPALGGTASSITLRIARSWLSVARPSPARRTPLHEAAFAATWRAWADSVRKEERYKRVQSTDDAIATMIKAMRDADRSLTATRGLRKLRDSGFACEQGRFRELFHRVSRANYESN